MESAVASLFDDLKVLCAFSSFHPALALPLAAFHVSIATTSIVSVTVKRNLADVSRDPTPSSSYFDSQSPYLSALIFLSFLPPTAARFPPKYLQALQRGSLCPPRARVSSGQASVSGAH